SSTKLTVQFSCDFLRPVEAVLLLISSSGFGIRCATRAFSLKTRISQITPTVPLVNMLLEEALAVWAQHRMSASERRRRILTRSLHSSTINETRQDWNVQALVCGEGFSGPEVVNVPAGTKESYPLTFHPSSQCIVTGKLCLHNDCDGTEHVFTLRGVGEPPLPVDHIVLFCPVGRTTYAQLDVPNYSQTKLTLRVQTEVSRSRPQDPYPDTSMPDPLLRHIQSVRSIDAEVPDVSNL
ncbi:hypothetical protein GOODEAATRI_018316, partial [Goodea atripinnis]